MSCRAFRRGWQPGAPDTHAMSCGACAQWLAGQRDLSGAVTRLKASLDGPPPPSREAELRAAFRGSYPSAPPRPLLGRFLGWAAAAGFVGFLALVVGRPFSAGRGERAQSPAVPATPALGAPSAKPRPSGGPRRLAHPAAPRTPPREPSATAPLLDAPRPEAVAVSTPPVPSKIASDRAPQVALADEDEAEDAPERVASEQSFYPLVPDREPSAIESGQIVRVQLRPDVLDAAGMPTRTLGSGPVEAEVLMGPDGVALGIRLPRPKR